MNDQERQSKTFQWLAFVACASALKLSYDDSQDALTAIGAESLAGFPSSNRANALSSVAPGGDDGPH